MLSYPSVKFVHFVFLIWDATEVALIEASKQFIYIALSDQPQAEHKVLNTWHARKYTLNKLKKEII